MTTFPTKETQHSSPQSIILISQTVAAPLCTHLKQDVFIFLINLSASIWEAFLYKQWKSVGKPKSAEATLGSCWQDLTEGITGTGMHPWKKLMQVCTQTYKCTTHTLLTHASSLLLCRNHMPTWAHCMCNARMMLRLSSSPHMNKTNGPI